MADKLTEYVEVPRSIRVDESLKRKMQIVAALRGRRLQDQMRFSIMLGVDQEITELGQKAFDLLCGGKLEIQQKLETQQSLPGLKKLEKVGNGKNRLEKMA